jgi:hypothetical protein
MKTKSTRTSRHSRFSLKFDGEYNIWTAFDKKFKDTIYLTIEIDKAEDTIKSLNSGTGFADWQIPRFLHGFEVPTSKQS